MSSLTPKSVVFNMIVGEEKPAAAPQGKPMMPRDTRSRIKHGLGEESEGKLAEMVQELSAALQNVKHEQEYMEVRERTHRMSEAATCLYTMITHTYCIVNDSTNARVVYWAVFEAILLIMMTIGQIYYLHRFFEVRATV